MSTNWILICSLSSHVVHHLKPPSFVPLGDNSFRYLRFLCGCHSMRISCRLLDDSVRTHVTGVPARLVHFRLHKAVLFANTTPQAPALDLWEGCCATFPLELTPKLKQKQCQRYAQMKQVSSSTNLFVCFFIEFRV